MRNFVLIAAAAAIVGLSLPVISAQAEEGKVVIKTGDRHHHRHWRDHDRKKVVIIKKREHHHRHHGAMVIKER